MVSGSLAPPRIFKIVWPGVKDKWPAAYEVLKALNVANAVQEPLMGLADNDGQDVSEVVQAWVDANESVWKPWVDAAM